MFIKKSILCLTATFLIATQAYGFSEHIDDNTLSTTGKKMHVCNTGYMSGIHVHHNDLLCATDSPIAGFDDYNTKRADMHACPQGSIMIGIHVDDNVLKCSYISPQARTYPEYEIISLSTSPNIIRFGMHACPVGYVMTGVHVRSNVLLCNKLFIM